MEKIQLIMIAMGVLSIALTFGAVVLRAEVNKLRNENRKLVDKIVRDGHYGPEYCANDICPFCQKEEKEHHFEQESFGFIMDEYEEEDYTITLKQYYQSYHDHAFDFAGCCEMDYACDSSVVFEEH
jgi:hypothetical protein